MANKYYEKVMELKTVRAWSTGIEVYGDVVKVVAAVKTLPLVAAAAGIEVGFNKTKAYLENKKEEREERVTIIIKQYNVDNTAKAEL